MNKKTMLLEEIAQIPDDHKYIAVLWAFLCGPNKRRRQNEPDKREKPRNGGNR